MHSSAYNEFVKRVNTDGYKQGYNEKLFELIFPEELDDVKTIIEEKFNNGDNEMSVFMPKIQNGKEKLEARAHGLNKTCYAYCLIMRVLYNSTQKECYFDNLIEVLNSDDEDVRLDAIFCLLKCGKSKKLYEVFRHQCMIDEDEDVRLSCVDGMFYCQNIISNPFRIQTLEQPWEQLKLEMFDCDRDKEERINSILEFEKLVGV